MSLNISIIRLAKYFSLSPTSIHALLIQHICVLCSCVYNNMPVICLKKNIYSKQMKSNDVRLAENIGVDK